MSIISLREGFDLSTPIGKAMLTMLAAVAELERSNIKARQMAGIAKAKAEAKHWGEKRPLMMLPLLSGGRKTAQAFRRPPNILGFHPPV